MHFFIILLTLIVTIFCSTADRLLHTAHGAMGRAHKQVMLRALYIEKPTVFNWFLCVIYHTTFALGVFDVIFLLIMGFSTFGWYYLLIILVLNVMVFFMGKYRDILLWFVFRKNEYMYFLMNIGVPQLLFSLIVVVTFLVWLFTPPY